MDFGNGMGWTGYFVVTPTGINFLQSGFNNAVPSNWTVAGETAGLARTFDGLTFLEVYNAGRNFNLW